MLLNAFHLSYCTNIHPGENWDITFQSLKENLPKIKERVAPNKHFGVGLRLSNLASEELGLDTDLREFKGWLKKMGCYVFTMNGFPYGNFHGERVKDLVHAPDWTTAQRFEYTSRLFDQLRQLLSDGMEGGISTSPISYKHWHKDENAINHAFESGAKHMAKIAVKLFRINEEYGTYLHLDVEPEPDGLLQNTDEVVSFFKNYLVPAAMVEFGKMGVDSYKAEALVKKYITICYDVCHFSLAYEEPEVTFRTFADNDIRVGKIQISAALKILGATAKTEDLWSALRAFDEPTYLHQVTEEVAKGVRTFSDLPDLFENKNEFEELRAHFHVPIFLESFGLLHSTQDHIIKTLYYLKKHPDLTKHLEVETYTWEVLPKTLKAPLVDSVVRELNWVKDNLE